MAIELTGYSEWTSSDAERIAKREVTKDMQVLRLDEKRMGNCQRVPSPVQPE